MIPIAGQSHKIIFEGEAAILVATIVVTVPDIIDLVINEEEVTTATVVISTAAAATIAIATTAYIATTSE